MSRSPCCSISYRSGSILWIVATLLTDSVQAQTNATATDSEIYLPYFQCGGVEVDPFPGFATALGGTPPTSSAVSASANLTLYEDSLDRPVCGGVTPGEKGYWFPVSSVTYGKVDLLFCTMTDTPLTITATVYQAPRVSDREIINCEDMSCVAIGTKDPLQSDTAIRTKGNVCPSAPNSGGVHFTAIKGQRYFVHVDVMTDLGELMDFEAISVVESGTSYASPSWTATAISLLLCGFLEVVKYLNNY